MPRERAFAHDKTTLLIRIFAALILAGLSFPRVSPASEAAQKIQELLQKGDVAAAQSLLTQALKETPGDAGLYNLQGVVQAQRGDFAGSEASFKKALELAPNFEGAYLNLGHLYQERIPQEPAARDHAIKVYAQILKFEPDHIDANYQSAVLLMQKGSYEASLQHLSRLPAAEQSRAQILSIRCGDYAGSGEKSKAEAVADRMLQNPDLVEADVTTLLPLLARQKDAALAIRLLEGLEKRSLASFGALHSLGLLYKQQGRLDEARKALNQAAQLQPESVPVLMELA